MPAVGCVSDGNASDVVSAFVSGCSDCDVVDEVDVILSFSL